MVDFPWLNTIMKLGRSIATVYLPGMPDLHSDTLRVYGRSIATVYLPGIPDLHSDTLRVYGYVFSQAGHNLLFTVLVYFHVNDS